MAGDYSNIGNVCYDLDNFPEALRYQLTAKTIMLNFVNDTGFNHPLLNRVKDRIAQIAQKSNKDQ